MQITVSTYLDASPEEAWADLENLQSHVEWMHDAAKITMQTDQTQGVGTTFVCDTVVGPLKTADLMTITEWEPAKAMGVKHEGMVTGEGRFTLEAEGDGTRFSWDEELNFPLWLGGPIGEIFGKPILTFVWKRNLELLARRFQT